jgi:hypothetical protein
MTTSDGSILGTTKIVDHGPASSRWNLVILGDGYRQRAWWRPSQISKYHDDVQSFVDQFHRTHPFDKLWDAINIYRVDVVSRDSGADDPKDCGGTGATARTYFDATFCNYGIRRLLMVNSRTALSVAASQVPEVHETAVVVNSTAYGGSGGAVAVFSLAPGASEIGIHEMGHSAFGLADEYEYYSGCGSGEKGHDRYAGSEPAQPNITTIVSRERIKWGGLVDANTPLPASNNGDCTRCDPQPNPFPDRVVGAFEGAYYNHCGVYRPEFNCRMRALGNPFCAACQQTITAVLKPFLSP